MRWSAPCTGDDVDADDLIDWIADLRGRVARGELAGMGAIDIDGVVLPVELVARIMLADLAAEDVTPEQRHDPDAERRRRALLRDARRLHE